MAEKLIPLAKDKELFFIRDTNHRVEVKGLLDRIEARNIFDVEECAKSMNGNAYCFLDAPGNGIKLVEIYSISEIDYNVGLRLLEEKEKREKERL